MRHPQVTIAVVSYNRLQYLRALMESASAGAVFRVFPKSFGTGEWEVGPAF